MVADLRVVPDVLPVSENDVFPNFHERLQDVVLEDEAVLAEVDVPPDERACADVRRRPVAEPLRRLVQASPQRLAWW